MMKRIFVLIMMALAFQACEKKCEEYTSADIVGTYQNQNTVAAYMYVTSNGDNRIRIDDHYTGTITSCGEIDVIEQTFQHPVTNNDITVSGSMEFIIDGTTSTNGQLTGGKKIVVNLTFLTQGQTIPEKNTYYFQ
jgi:hypothetical protein